MRIDRGPRSAVPAPAGEVGGAPHGRGTLPVEPGRSRQRHPACIGGATCARSGTARRRPRRRPARCPRSPAHGGPSGSTTHAHRRPGGERGEHARGRRRGGTRRRAGRRCAASSTRGRSPRTRLVIASLSPSPSATLRARRSRSGPTSSVGELLADGGRAGRPGRGRSSRVADRRTPRRPRRRRSARPRSAST